MNTDSVAPTAMQGNTNEVVLIDLSSIAYPIWHVTQSDADPNKASQQIAARVRALASGHTRVAICCDSGRSFRHDIAASYKANRPEREAPLHHQIALAKEQLEADGFPVWSVKGFEADDLIASAAGKVTDPVIVVTGDKDLLQLVTDRVRVKNATSGAMVDADAVAAKFGVRPEQMRDYLTLVGDSSDNIAGAKGIGPKKAAELLAKFGTLDRVFEDLSSVGAAAMGLQQAVAASLRVFKADGFETTRKLVTLRTDVEVPVEELTSPRVAKAVEEFDVAALDADTPAVDEPSVSEEQQEPVSGPVAVAAPMSSAPVAPGQQMEVRQPQLDVLESEPAGYERQLDPRSLRDARILAKDMHDSRLFSAYGTPQAVLSTVMLGRELGLPAMASLRAVHIIEGRHSLSAQAMVALILKSGMAEYFRPVSFSESEATYETLRKGPGNQPIRLQHTIEMATKAGLVKDKSGWQKNPTDMLVARASSRLARMVYPDIVGGLYTPEELADLREAVA